MEGECGKSLHHLWYWKNLDNKLYEHGNHSRFTLWCISQDLVQVSLKLKTTIKTNRTRKIVHKAEKKLHKECIRTINNTIEFIALKRQEWGTPDLNFSIQQKCAYIM